MFHKNQLNNFFVSKLFSKDVVLKIEAWMHKRTGKRISFWHILIYFDDIWSSFSKSNLDFKKYIVISCETLFPWKWILILFRSIKQWMSKATIQRSSKDRISQMGTTCGGSLGKMVKNCIKITNSTILGQNSAGGQRGKANY